MKTITKMMMLFVLCFAALVYGQTDRTDWMSSTARIIRVDEFEDALLKGELPMSYTGALVSTDGHVFTAYHDGIIKHEEHVSKTPVEYLVIFPVISHNEKEKTYGVVNAIKIYRGFHHCSSAENSLVCIKIAPHALPELFKFISNVSNTYKSGDPIMSIGYGTYRLDGPVMKTATDEINRWLASSLDKIQKGADYDKIDNNREECPHLMSFVTPHIIDGSYSDAIGTRSQARIFRHNMNISDPASLGGVVLDGRGIVMGTLTHPDLSQCYDSTVSNAMATKYNIPIVVVDGTEPGTEFSAWLYVAIVGVIVLVVLLIYHLKKIGGRGNRGGDKRGGDKRGGDKGEHGHGSRVIMVLKGQNGERYEITSQMVRDRVELGRSSSVALRFASGTVSSHHARLCKVNGRPGIEDMDSKGGTYLNGEKIKPHHPVALHSGDVIKLADYVVRVKGA